MTHVFLLDKVTLSIMDRKMPVFLQKQQWHGNLNGCQIKK